MQTEDKTSLGRRQFLRALGAGAAVAAASPLASGGESRQREQR